MKNNGFFSFTCLMNADMKNRANEICKKFNDNMELYDYYKMADNFNIYICQINIIDYNKNIKQVSEYFNNLFDFIAFHIQTTNFIYIKDRGRFLILMRNMKPEENRLKFFITNMMTYEERMIYCVKLANFIKEKKEDISIVYKDIITNQNVVSNIFYPNSLFFTSNFDFLITNGKEMKTVNLINDNNPFIKKVVFV